MCLGYNVTHRERIEASAPIISISIHIILDMLLRWYLEVRIGETCGGDSGDALDVKQL